MGHLLTVDKKYDLAISRFRRAKELNQASYKYPSELVSVAWLPAMIDFDLLSVLVLVGRQEICSINFPSYFEKIIDDENIIITLSPDR